ncbi:ABC-type multidrug transport system fused ATPase/permease subunit [Plantactinospora soyae]|uniref:ABC-type multidrug transport system fused ATPase/permease subunit n=1 Tax=Plantactinospora soyae TaxID=1544732 RepID=A0A927RAE8_9ACTN|nr:ABC transporter ATP-binding protein [Plantactinospora soyae]MBE1492314.1 ABC-type multidrug transport system fused ATPase/permease subunit [Plantactinospora soyae]
MAGKTSRDVLIRGIRVLGHAVREEPRIFSVAVGGSVLYSLLIIASAYVVGAVVGDVVVPSLESGRADTTAVVLSAVALLAVSLGRVLGMFGRRIGAGFMQYRLQASYRRRITRRYLELPLSWHHRHATGTLLSNANSDVEAAWFPIAPLPFAVGTLVMLVAAMGSLLVTDWVLALVGVAIFPALFALNVVYSRRMAPRQARAQQMRAEVSAIAHESFDGALVVKTMGQEARETARFAAQAGELRDALISVGRLRGVFDPMLETLPSLGTLAVLLVGAVRLGQGAVTITELVSVAFLFTVLAFPVRAIGWVLAELPRSVAGWDRLQAVLTATGEMPYGNTTLDRREGGPATLVFERVDFGYALTEPAPATAPAEPGLSTEPEAAARPVGVPAPADEFDSTGASVPTEPAPGAGVTAPVEPVPTESAPAEPVPVLHDVSFTVPAGRTVALVGPTGSGKSTIVSLAVRLVDPDAGAVTLDGVDVRSLTAASLADTTALVAQVPFVFDDTIRANITLDRAGITDDHVWTALRLAEADGFVAALPDGLDTLVGERGASLSGGQRQRLTLARALAGRPRLLVLDDATSAVDPRVEAAILAALRAPATAPDTPPPSTAADPTPGDADTAALPPGASILVVAYRRATIALADEVVYVEHGRVVGRGTHATLLRSTPGYAALVTAYERAEAERERERAYEEPPPGTPANRQDEEVDA